MVEELELFVGLVLEQLVGKLLEQLQVLEQISGW